MEILVTNLGKHNEGRSASAWLKLPATKEDVHKCLRTIGLDGINYEEYRIDECRRDDFYMSVDEWDKIDELNYLASLIQELDEGELECFEAALDFGEYTNAANLINLSQNLETFHFYPGVRTDQEFGEYLIEECGAMEVPEHLSGYIDYEAYGRDVLLETSHVVTHKGILERENGATNYYSGIEDIPDEYRVFSFPRPTYIRTPASRQQERQQPER